LNTADYGNNIGSYAYKLKIINEDQSFLKNLSSGSILDQPLYVGLFDQEDQLVTYDNKS